MNNEQPNENDKEAWGTALNSRGRAINDVLEELRRAEGGFPAMRSAHEGFSILNEEVDELWEEVKVKQSKRNMSALRAEAVQVAAMAIRFIKDVCEKDGKGYGQ